VLGILAAIVVFALGNVTSSSAAAACTTDAQSVNVAIAAEQASIPGTPPVLVSGSAAGDLVPAYLATMPTNSAFVITVSGTNTMVQLVSGDPGYTYEPVVSAIAVPEQYNGGVWVFPTGNAYSGKGICAGA
jgi:hypothetical protein